MKVCAFLLAFATTGSWGQSQFPKWQEGYLDIHHISTGSGNATLFIFPDGTTLLFDAGDVDRKARLRTPNPLKVSPHLPNDSSSSGKCIVSYSKGVYPSISTIDYAVISHFHSDHYGSLDPSSRLSAKGNYYLTGITEVNEYLPVRTLIDRNYPAYDYPVDLKTNVLDKETFANYLAFVATEVEKKTMRAEALVPGSNIQNSSKK